MVPIVIGVAMVWYSEMEITRSTVWVSVVCIVLNAVKVVINSEMLTGEFKVRHKDDNFLQYERLRLFFFFFFSKGFNRPVCETAALQ